jgi:hypothetical protein
MPGLDPGIHQESYSDGLPGLAFGGPAMTNWRYQISLMIMISPMTPTNQTAVRR